jgi:hypothetical protein
MRLPHVLRPSDGTLSRGHDSQPNTPPAGGHTWMLDKLPMTASLRHTPSLSSNPASPSSKNTSGTGTGSNSGSRHQRRPRTAPASRSSPSSSAGRFTLKLGTTMDVLPAPLFNVNSNNSHDRPSSSIISAEAGPSRPPRSSRRSGVNVPSSLSLSAYVVDDSVLLSSSTASSSLTDDSSSTHSHSRPETPILFAPLPSKRLHSPVTGAAAAGDCSGAAPFSRSTTPHDPLTYSVPRRSQSVDDLTHPVSPSSTLHLMSLSSLSPPNSASAPTHVPVPAKPPVRDPYVHSHSL